MFAFQQIFLISIICYVWGDQHRYIFVHEKLTLEDFDPKVVDVTAGLYNLGDTMALNFSFTLKIDLPKNAKASGTALKWVNNDYRLGLVQVSTTIKQALEMEAFDLQKLIVDHFRPPLIWPLQKGVTYRSIGWTPDVTKFPPNLPEGKWKIQLTFTFANKTKFGVASWFLTLVYKK